MQMPLIRRPIYWLAGGVRTTFWGDRGDTMTGGEGTDSFTVYNRVGDDVPDITDFNSATEGLVILVDGPATGVLSFRDGADGVGVRLDGNFVAFLRGVESTDLRPGSIRLQSAA